MVLDFIIIATVVVSLISLIGVFLITAKKKISDSSLLMLVSLSAGTLLGGAFLDLLPHSIEELSAESVLPVTLSGLLVFFVLEKVIVWHHHHSAMHLKKVNERPLGYLTLVGDALHNFFDGVAIAASFIVSPSLGVITTVAVALHEIPQEIGDFSLLLYSGFTKTRALLFNLGSALFAVLGALIFYFATPLVENLEAFGLAFTAGMFIYLATADIVPELNK